MKRYSKIFLTIAITIGTFAINYGINFFLTPYITDNVGTEAYGYVSLAKTIASYANIITVALNGYASRFIAVEYHNQRYRQANVYYSSVLYADLGLSFVIFALMTAFSVNINRVFEIDQSILWDIIWLFILIFLNLAINISTTVLQAAAYIKDKLDIIAVFRGISYFAEAVVLIMCYTCLPARVTYVGIGIIAGTATICCCNVYITRKYTPELKADIKLFSVAAVHKLVSSGIWNSISSIGSLLNTGFDLIVANLMLSPLAMGQISIVKSITTIFATVYQQVATPFQPILLRDYAVNNKKGLLKNLINEIKVEGWISAIILMGFASLGKLYFKLWVPNQDVELLYKVSMIAVFSGIIEGAANPLYYVYTLTVKNKIPSLFTIFGGLCNITGMYLLIRYTGMGIYAVQWTTAIVALATGLIFNPVYSAHCLNLSWTTFYPVLFRHIGSCLTVGVILYGIAAWYNPSTWLGLIVCAVIEGVIGGAVYFILIFSMEEKKAVLSTISFRLKRINVN